MHRHLKWNRPGAGGTEAAPFVNWLLAQPNYRGTARYASAEAFGETEMPTMINADFKPLAAGAARACPGERQPGPGPRPAAGRGPPAAAGAGGPAQC